MLVRAFEAVFGIFAVLGYQIGVQIRQIFKTNFDESELISDMVPTTFDARIESETLTV